MENESVIEKTNLFHKDFTLVVIGQIISLFGNCILRFALPLYILDQSGSAALFGLISAASFLPMIIMSPIGGIIADRVNKQRIMVVLDFLTAAIILVFIFVSGTAPLVPLVLIVLMLLYAIQGAYAPAVQASMPVLAKGENLAPANAIINLVQSLSGLLGPVIGGVLYATYGLSQILIVSCICFFVSAVMELFISIPYIKQKASGSVFNIVKDDFKKSLQFITKEKPIIAKVIAIIFTFNIFMSSMMVIGIPVLITQYLNMGSELYGITQGSLAAGGLVGGVLAGVLGNKLNIKRSYLSLTVCALGILPMGILLLFDLPVMVSYFVITGIGFLLMAAATLFSVQMLVFVQAQTPIEIVGKVISLLMALCMCAQPIGQAMYGLLFERLADVPGFILIGASFISFIIAFYSKETLSKL